MTPGKLVPKTRRKVHSYHLLWNAIRRAKIHHQLPCGCTIKPGTAYHSTGMLINGRFTYAKQHLRGCLEALH